MPFLNNTAVAAHGVTSAVDIRIDDDARISVRGFHIDRDLSIVRQGTITQTSGERAVTAWAYHNEDGRARVLVRSSDQPVDSLPRVVPIHGG